MTLYVDSSAWLKRYIEEAGSKRASEIMESDPDLLTGRHTVVEMRRNLARLLSGRALSGAREDLAADLSSFNIVELDEATCDLACTIAEHTMVRTLDAMHLACAQRAGGTAIPFLTFDVRQAQTARSLGMTVLGS